jgi:hypothetical protein
MRSIAEKATSIPRVLRGSLITLTRKCGKPGCRCTRGELHTTPALSTSIDGKTTILTLRDTDLPEVQSALARYKRARADLDQEARAGLRALRERLKHTKPRKRTAGKKGAL